MCEAALANLEAFVDFDASGDVVLVAFWALAA